MLSRSLSRCFILTLVLAGYFTPVSAQQSAQQSAQPAEAAKKARIEGSVVSSTGAPLARATLTLRGTAPAVRAGATGSQGTPTGPATYSATSDSEGKFVLEDVEPGNGFRLTAQKAGFNDASFGARSTNSPAISIKLGPGQELKGVALVMTPQAVITGKITDMNGEPVRNARVTLLGRSYSRGVRTVTAAGSASSNDQGEYRIANLTAGRYYVSAADQPGALVLLREADANSSALSKLTTYYPNSPDLAGAAPIDIAAGSEHRGIDLQLRSGKTFVIRGKAVDAQTGEVVAGIVRGTPKNSPNQDPTVLQSIVNSTKPDGTFEIVNLTPGTYILQNRTGNITLSGVKPPNLTGTMEVTIADRNVEGIVLPLGRGATITGTLKLENGDIATVVGKGAPANAPTQALLDAEATTGRTLARPSRTVTLIPAQGIGAGGTGPIKEDGTFHIEFIPSDKYFLNLPLPPGYYAKSATLGGTDIVHNPLDLSSGSGGEMQILISDKAGTVTGQVANDKGEPQGNIAVTLWSTVPEGGSLANGVHFAFTDAGGNFQFANLAPGEYRAAAWEDIDRQLALVRDFLDQFNGAAEKSKLAESGSVSLNLKVNSVDKIKAAEAKLP